MDGNSRFLTIDAGAMFAHGTLPSLDPGAHSPPAAGPARFGGPKTWHLEKQAWTSAGAPLSAGWPYGAKLTASDGGQDQRTGGPEPESGACAGPSGLAESTVRAPGAGSAGRDAGITEGGQLSSEDVRHWCVRRSSQTVTSNRICALMPPIGIGVIWVSDAWLQSRGLPRRVPLNRPAATFNSRINDSTSSAAAAHGRHVRQWTANRRASAVDSRFMMYASAVSSISLGHVPGEVGKMDILVTLSAGPKQSFM